MLFFTFWAGLLVAPISALIMWRKRWREWEDFPIKRTAAFSVLVFLATRHGYLLIPPIANVFLWVSAYFCYCTSFIPMAHRIQWKWARYISLTVIFLPVLAGYLLSTIGALGLLSITDKLNSSWANTSKLVGNIWCESHIEGSVFTGSGYEITLYQRYTLLPFLQKRLVTQYSDFDDKGNTPSMSCQSALTQWNANHK